MKNEKTQLRKLYLDDVRVPKTEGWEIVRSYKEFVEWIEKNGLPNEISIDHDLSDNKPTDNSNLVVDSDWTKEKTGYDAAKFVCEYCWTNGLPIPTWNVHSANPVGRDNIIQILKSYEKKLNS